MQLIRKSEPIISKDGRKRQRGIFFCDYCKKEVEKCIYGGTYSQSCGCQGGLKGENNPHYIHGKTGTKIYNLWLDMIKRCNPNSKDIGNQRWYVKRGITVCDEWRQSFLEFEKWATLHYKPGLLIDRIDNDKGYFPGNVRFVTIKESNNNTRSSIKSQSFIPQIQQAINDGKRYVDILKQYPIGKTTFYRYIYRGLLKHGDARPSISIKAKMPQIQCLINDGKNKTEISKACNVSIPTVSKYIKLGFLIVKQPTL